MPHRLFYLRGKVKEQKRFSLELSWVITYAVIAYLIATDIYAPRMPSITRYFGATEDLIQLTMVSFMLGAFASTLCSGGIRPEPWCKNLDMNREGESY